MGWKATFSVLVPILIGIFTLSPEVSALPQLGNAQPVTAAAAVGVQETSSQSASSTNSSSANSTSTSVLGVGAAGAVVLPETVTPAPSNSTGLNGTSNANVNSNVNAISNTNVNSNLNALSNTNVNSNVNAISNTNVNNNVNSISNANVNHNVNAISNTNVNNNVNSISNANVNSNVNAISNTNVNSNLNAISNKNINSNTVANVNTNHSNVDHVAHDDDDDDDDSDEYDDDEEYPQLRRKKPHHHYRHHHHHYDYSNVGLGMPMMPMSFSPQYYHHDHYYHHKRPHKPVTPAVAPVPYPNQVQPGPVVNQPGSVGGTGGSVGGTGGSVGGSVQPQLVSSYFGVQFTPYVHLENYTYTVEDIKTMLKVILTKYHNVQTYDITSNSSTFVENSPVSLIAQAAALVNQESNSLAISVLRNARVLEQTSSIGGENLRAGNGSEINATVHLGNVMGSAHIGGAASAFNSAGSNSSEVVISEQQTEIDQAIHNIQQSNQLYNGTVWGLTLGVNSLHEGGHVTDFRSGRLVYLQAQRLFEKVKPLNIRLGVTINICDEIYGTNQEIRAMLLDLAKVTDFFVCSIYPQAPVVSAEQYFQNVTSIYLRIRESFQQVNPNLEIMLDTGLPSEGVSIRNPSSGAELSTVEKMVTFYGLVERWSVEYKVRVFMHEAFDVPQAVGENHYGYFYRAPDNSNRYICKATGQYVVT